MCQKSRTRQKHILMGKKENRKQNSFEFVNCVSHKSDISQREFRLPLRTSTSTFYNILISYFNSENIHGDFSKSNKKKTFREDIGRHDEKKYRRSG